MRQIGGHTVIAHVLLRCRSIVGADVVVCAIPRVKNVMDWRLRHYDVVWSFHEGSESDVLDRYRRAAQHIGANVVMQVTSDCPLIDPGLCSAVLRLRSEEDADYACNNMPPSWAHGLDCEAFTMQALERAADQAVLPLEREHVTPWLRTHPLLKRVNLADPEAKSVQYRWTLDFPEDFEFFRALADTPAGVARNCKHGRSAEGTRRPPSCCCNQCRPKRSDADPKRSSKSLTWFWLFQIIFQQTQGPNVMASAVTEPGVFLGWFQVPSAP